MGPTCCLDDLTVNNSKPAVGGNSACGQLSWQRHLNQVTGLQQTQDICTSAQYSKFYLARKRRDALSDLRGLLSNSPVSKAMS